MKKRIVSLALLLFLCCIPTLASDADFEIANGVLIKYHGPGGDVAIPNGVTSIGNSAFYGCSTLTSLTIPDSVTSIGSSFVDDCSSLKSLTFGNGLKKIPDAMFYSVNRPGALTSIILGDGVEEIGAYAFANCNLEHISFGNNMKTIGERAFNNALNSTNITLPKSVTSIGFEAFANCSGLTSVTIPQSVASLARGVFNGCDNLTEITFQNDSVPDAMFYSVNRPYRLKSVILGDNVKQIGAYAFGQCSLTSVKCGKGLRTIGDNAFFGCIYLNRINLPNGLTAIGECAFDMCRSLTSVTIPSSVLTIGTAAFHRTGIGHIYYAGSEERWRQIGGDDVAFHGDVTVHYNRALPLSGVIQEPDATISRGQYCLQIVDANGNPLSGAAVTWGTESGVTDNKGQVFFETPDATLPAITATLDGYQTWSNENVTMPAMSDNLSQIPLLPDGFGRYKLACALYYPNFRAISDGKAVDLLTKTKILNLKNNGALVGETSGTWNGDFFLRCAANNLEGVERYELWQKRSLIGTSKSGEFDSLNVRQFSKGGGCFIRVIAENGGSADTDINLEFTEVKINGPGKVALSDGNFTFEIPDSVPFLGGSVAELSFPDLPVEFEVTDDKITLFLNLHHSNPNSSDKWADDTLTRVKALCDIAQHVKTKNWDAFQEMAKDGKFVKLPGGKWSAAIGGYVESKWGTSRAGGTMFLLLRGEFSGGFLTMVGTVPVTVDYSLKGYAQTLETIAYEWNSGRWINFARLKLEGEFEPFVGIGVGQLLSAGVYGGAKLNGSGGFFNKIPWLWKLTGSLGIKIYIANVDFKKSFAHQTWVLWPRQAQLQGITGNWPDSIYNASEYRISSLDYLSKESSWMGDTASLMEASARTELFPLLSDTYRNAQPVMAATDNALYVAFVRADADSGARYVVVTKFDGTSWSEPVRADANAILDSAPTLCADGNTVYLAYARTTENPGDSLLSYALKQEIVVGSVDPDTLSFTERATFSGLNPDSSFVSMPQVSAANGRTLLVWADLAVSDDNSVLRPASGVIRYAACSDGVWGNASDMGTVNAPVDSITIGERNAAPAIACLLDEDSGRNLYLLTASGQERISENVSGAVAYARLPGTDKASFLWNGENVLTSSAGNSAEVPGISDEYAISGNNVYYSAATDGSANLTVLQYHADSGTWGLPIQLTDGNRYLENLSVASLNGTDYALGMHTAATITENAVEDAKNLVWSAVRPVSDLRLDGIDYDAENIKAGEGLPVTLTVINAGDHTVNRIHVTLNNSAVKTQDCSLKPGESLDIEVSVSSPSSLSEYLFAVEEPDKDDHSPDDNEGTVQIGYADAAIELGYRQIGAKKALMATVTNRGVETASGSVAFYDANGSSIAESAFANLASGDTIIAVYELDGNFSGINGGDVSAKVTLEQEELYTYNNADTLHIMEAESNPEETEITNAVANGERGINAGISCESELTATAYCAFYNNDGKMLSMEIRSLSAGENRLTFTASNQAASKAQLFVLDNQMIPRCASKAIEIT